MFINKTYLQISIDQKDKDYIKKKAKDLGYNSASAFLIDSAKNHFKVEVDLSHYRELAKEVNYIGKNINSLVRHIFSVGVYSGNDLDIIKSNQKKIIEKLNEEYDHLLKIRKKYSSENMSLKDKKKLIEELTKKEIDIPRKLVLEEVYERIKEDIIYICEAIENSPDQEEGIDEYVWEYLYGNTLFSLDEKRLIEFSDRLFFFVQKLKVKLLNAENYFDDEDWFNLKEILDEYEVY
ncbi:hypothetical protein Q5W88_21580 [Shouchella clausii]|uniref:hypothetical protein n=1 Tax=Shouchella clausii TaxID=79880 RepID=UPI0026F4342F|nr:hypothetical protein [Shouchella clausii]MDO7285898.1 hypothetical protein [Shouchella clausii]MDO7305801.1 hypothetical protein [Shouchella clausii]